MKKYQRRSRADWQSLVTQQANSGLSAPVFCKNSDVSYPSFISWKKKLAASRSGASPSATFVEITPAATDIASPDATSQSSSTRACIELDVGSAMQLRIYST